MLDNIIEVLTIIIALTPVIVQLVGFIAQKTNNQKLRTLTERAYIVVTALEQSGLSNEHKKNKAMHKLAKYADEVGISMTADQLDDYIESAVKLLKALSN